MRPGAWNGQIRIRKKNCVDCQEEISLAATRCPYCTSFQDVRGFHAGPGQVWTLAALVGMAVFTYLNLQSNRITAFGHIAPALTRLEVGNKGLYFEVYNSGNLRADMKSLTVEGQGHMTAKPDLATRASFRFSFDKSERRIPARDSATTHVNFADAASIRIGVAYRSMPPDAVLATFKEGDARPAGECSAAMSFVDPHGSLGARTIVTTRVGCQIVTDLIIGLRSQTTSAANGR